MEMKENIKEKNKEVYFLYIRRAVACGFKKSMVHNICGFCTATYNNDSKRLQKIYSDCQIMYFMFAVTENCYVFMSSL